MAQWLTIVSWVAVILGLLSALAIAFDVAADPQHMKIMNVVWPDHRTLSSDRRLVALCRHGVAKADEGQACCTRWASVLEERVCLDDNTGAAGCVIGDITGAPIVFWAGWTLFGSRLYAEFLVLFVLAYIFGIAFQYLPIRAMRRISGATRFPLKRSRPTHSHLQPSKSACSRGWPSFIFSSYRGPS